MGAEEKEEEEGRRCKGKKDWQNEIYGLRDKNIKRKDQSRILRCLLLVQLCLLLFLSVSGWQWRRQRTERRTTSKRGIQRTAQKRAETRLHRHHQRMARASHQDEKVPKVKPCSENMEEWHFAEEKTKIRPPGRNVYVRLDAPKIVSAFLVQFRVHQRCVLFLTCP